MATQLQGGLCDSLTATAGGNGCHNTAFRAALVCFLANFLLDNLDGTLARALHQVRPHPLYSEAPFAPVMTSICTCHTTTRMSRSSLNKTLPAWLHPPDSS